MKKCYFCNLKFDDDILECSNCHRTLIDENQTNKDFLILEIINYLKQKEFFISRHDYQILITPLIDKMERKTRYINSKLIDFVSNIQNVEASSILNDIYDLLEELSNSIMKINPSNSEMRILNDIISLVNSNLTEYYSIFRLINLPITYFKKINLNISEQSNSLCCSEDLETIKQIFHIFKECSYKFSQVIFRYDIKKISNFEVNLGSLGEIKKMPLVDCLDLLNEFYQLPTFFYDENSKNNYIIRFIDLFLEVVRYLKYYYLNVNDSFYLYKSQYFTYINERLSMYYKNSYEFISSILEKYSQNVLIEYINKFEYQNNNIIVTEYTEDKIVSCLSSSVDRIKEHYSKNNDSKITAVFTNLFSENMLEYFIKQIKKEILNISEDAKIPSVSLINYSNIKSQLNLALRGESKLIIFNYFQNTENLLINEFYGAYSFIKKIINYEGDKKILFFTSYSEDLFNIFNRYENIDCIELNFDDYYEEQFKDIVSNFIENRCDFKITEDIMKNIVDIYMYLNKYSCKNQKSFEKFLTELLLNNRHKNPLLKQLDCDMLTKFCIKKNILYTDNPNFKLITYKEYQSQIVGREKTLKLFSKLEQCVNIGILEKHGFIIKGSDGSGKHTLANLLFNFFYEKKVITRHMLLNCSASDSETFNNMINKKSNIKNLVLLIENAENLFDCHNENFKTLKKIEQILSNDSNVIVIFLVNEEFDIAKIPYIISKNILFTFTLPNMCFDENKNFINLHLTKVNFKAEDSIIDLISQIYRKKSDSNVLNISLLNLIIDNILMYSNIRLFESDEEKSIIKDDIEEYLYFNDIKL